MRASPFTNTGAAIVFYAAFIVFVVLEMRTRLRGGLSREGSSADSGSIVVVWLSVVVALVGAFALARSAHGRWPVFVVGIVLMVAGIALRQWSVHTLGRFFTVDVRIHENQTVVESGPYRWVRHPSYTGLLLTLLGVGLALGNWAALALLIVVPTAGVVARIRVEERALERGLGEPYRRFEATRARLIPGVW